MPVIALVGNPNTGKTTLFNRLTGLNQHTGNWPGKTVLRAEGRVSIAGEVYQVVDLPGTYTLLSATAEELVARDFLVSGSADATVVVADATALERNLSLALQVMEITPKVVLCVNLIDEADRKGLTVDIPALSRELGIPVVCTNARTGEGVDELLQVVKKLAKGEMTTAPRPMATPEQAADAEGRDSVLTLVYAQAAAIAERVVHRTSAPASDSDQWLDNIITSRLWGFPIMLAVLGITFWLTITAANIPSAYLSALFFRLEKYLTAGMQAIGAPDWLHGFLVLGVYRGLAWVVAVMLPPMSIFFPLFTLLEDLGFLPRVAFNLDRVFCAVGAHGKQALTMAMGFGCNAAGVVATRIIESPRERLIAIITNNFVPCNGRFPTLIAMASLFLASGVGAGQATVVAAGVVVGMVLIGFVVTLAVSWLLSRTLLRGEPSHFALELPPYRKPQPLRLLARSLLDRVAVILRRAVVVAAPAGGITWLMANLHIGDASLLAHLASALDGYGRLLGLDGMILAAFILGLPANETVMPIMLMGYLAEGALLELGSFADLKRILVDQQGWTWLTALNVMLFSLLHYPCTTTLLTIYQETKSRKWAVISVLLPLCVASAVTFTVAQLARLCR